VADDVAGRFGRSPPYPGTAPAARAQDFMLATSHAITQIKNPVIDLW